MGMVDWPVAPFHLIPPHSPGGRYAMAWLRFDTPAEKGHRSSLAEPYPPSQWISMEHSITHPTIACSSVGMALDGAQPQRVRLKCAFWY